MAQKDLPDADHIVRHVPRSGLRISDGVVVGVLHTTFRLRPADGHALSAAWLEFFNGSVDQQFAGVIDAFVGNRKIKKREAFAIGQVLDVKKACQKFGVKVRIVHDPLPGFQSHASVRQFQDSDDQLLEALADEAWADSVFAIKTTEPSSIPR